VINQCELTYEGAERVALGAAEDRDGEGVALVRMLSLIEGCLVF
jgi:hypothetical protein